MFEISIRKRMSQLFCNHNYFAVAVTEHYQEIDNQAHKTASIYECKKCEHIKIIKKD